MNWRWLWLAMVGVVLIASLPRPARAAEPDSRATTVAQAAVVVVQGKIDDFERDALIRRFHQARAAGAKTIILQIDTTGGLVSSALDISRFIKQQNDLHTIAFIQNKAYSAGAMIAM